MGGDIDPRAVKPTATIFAGTFIHCKKVTDPLEIWEDAVVVVGGDGNGKILRIEKGGEGLVERVRGELEGEGFGEVFVRRTGEGEFYFPGFIGLWFSFSRCVLIFYFFLQTYALFFLNLFPILRDFESLSI